MNRPAVPHGDACPTNDYRHSHIDRGTTYDATIAGNPFDAYMAKWEAAHLAEIVRHLHPDGIPRYLDFACGTGRITELVSSFSQASVGVDVSKSMLEIARRKCPSTRFVEADVTSARLELGHFDVVTSFRFLGNAEDELRSAALAALARLLRPGGHLIVNNHRNPRSIASMLHRLTGGSDEMDLSYSKLRRMLSAHGFVVVRAVPIGFWLFRARMQASAENSRSAEWKERCFSWHGFVPFAPDMILLARRT